MFATETGSSHTAAFSQMRKRTGVRPKHARCARCIKQHKICDGGDPCELCSKVKAKSNHKRRDCWYPVGMPSRREFLENEHAYINAHEMKQQIDKTGDPLTEEQVWAMVPKLAATSKRHVLGSTGSKPRAGRGPKAATLSKTPNARSRVQLGQPRTLTAPRSPYTALSSQPTMTTDAPFRSGDDSKSDCGLAPRNEYFCQPRPGRIVTSLPDEIAVSRPDNAPIVSSPGQNQLFDAPPQPITPETIGIQLANTIEATAPRHVGGLLDGLSDWRGHMEGLRDLSDEEIRETEPMILEIGRVLMEEVRMIDESARGSRQGSVGGLRTPSR